MSEQKKNKEKRCKQKRCERKKIPTKKMQTKKVAFFNNKKDVKKGTSIHSFFPQKLTKCLK